MQKSLPITELHPGYSDNHATATPWSDALGIVQEAKIFWLSTVRPDGRPHVTSLIAVWVDDALYFCTGEHERKRRNLAENQHCVLTTGCNTYDEGIDIVIEGDAERITDHAELQRVADTYEAKYGSDWHFDVGNGVFQSGGREAWVYRVAPVTAFGFGKGDPFSQTRWRFQP
jgi:general stress protein 26